MTDKKILNFDKEYSYDGFWDIPIISQSKIPGILTLSPKKIKLKLLLESYDYQSLKENILPYNFETFCGTLQNNQKVTLLNCIIDGYTMPLMFMDEGCAKLEFSASACFLGEHYADIKKIKFDGINLCYKELRNWLGVKHVKTSNGDNKANIEFPMSIPADFTCNIGNSITISNSYTPTLYYSKETDPTYNLNPSLDFTFNTTQQSLEECLNLIDKWSIIQSIFIGCPFNINAISFIDGCSKSQFNIKKLNYIYYYEIREPYNENQLNNILFPYSCIENLEEVLQAWFNCNDETKELSKELFYSGFTKKNKTSKAIFLDLIQAIEGFADLANSGTYIDPKSGIIEELQKETEKILKKSGITNEDTVNALIGKIPDNNKIITLTSKFRKFVLEHLDTELLSSLKIDEKSTNKIIDYRHKLSHNKGKNSSNINYKELENINTKLTILLIYIFAIDNKMSTSTIKKYLLNSDSWVRQYINFLNQNEYVIN